jgi:hypothetical protein
LTNMALSKSSLDKFSQRPDVISDPRFHSRHRA